MTPEELIDRLERASCEHGIAPATITSRAVSNSRLYERLKGGGGCTLKIARKVLDFIDALDERRDAA